MRDYFAKMRGGAVALPPRAAWGQVAIAWSGGLAGIAAVAWLGQTSGVPLIMGSFGASCVLLFGFPESPFSQPRNVIGGHFLATLVGLLFLTLFGTQWWSMALALACALALMMVTRTVHPPAGSNPLIVMLGGAGWPFLWTPTLSGALVLVVVALLFNNLPVARRYPGYWW